MRQRFSTTSLVATAACMLAVSLAAQTVAPRPAARKALESQPLLLGTAWYPEQWPESRWDADLALMQAAHMHVVRVAEFAWSTIEPSESRYDFTWLDRAIAHAAKFDIKIVLGTPTAAPPAWLTSKYPDTLRVNEDGRREEHGNREQFSFSSPRYREFAVRIARAMAEHYGHNANVLGWQIDNEIGAPTFDASAVSQWHAWLAKKYGNVANLNTRWATSYWSQTYDNFNEVPFHSRGENPALLLDYKRFVTDTWISYVDDQVRVIRAVADPRQFITTNTMHWYSVYDHYKLHQDLDFAAWDDYVPDGHLDPFLNAASHDLVHGYKQQNFWLMETQPAFVNWGAVNSPLPPGVTREMAWQAIGHGADAVLYWQWRSAPNGQEEYHGMLLGADGTPVPVYTEIQHIGDDMDRVNAALQKSGLTLAEFSTHSDVAVLQDYDSHWAIDFQKHSNKFDYVDQILDLYHALAPVEGEGASSIDLISPLSELAKYKVVFAPALNVLPDATAKHLLDYVREGGMLVLGARSGMKNADNALQPDRQPGPLEAALGARVEQFYALDKPVAVQGEGVAPGTATIWAEQLRPLAPDVKVLLSYGPNEGWLAGHPAAVAHSYGKGQIVYIGATLDVPTMRNVLMPLLTQRAVSPLVAGLPKGVELSERLAPNGSRLWIIINHTDQQQHVSVPDAGTDLLTGHTSLPPQLEPHGIVVWSLTRMQ